MKTNKWWLQAGLVMLLVVALAACQQAQTIEGDARTQITDQAQPIADEILEGIDSGDYELFSQHFDAGLKEGLTESSFVALHQQFQEAIGNHLSCQVNTVQAVDEYNAVVYDCRYEKADSVTVRLVLTRDEPVLATGLWFDAPELR